MLELHRGARLGRPQPNLIPAPNATVRTTRWWRTPVRNHTWPFLRTKVSQLVQHERIDTTVAKAGKASEAYVPSSQIDAAEFTNYSSFALKMMSKMGFKMDSGHGKHEHDMISFTEPRPCPHNLGMRFHVLENPPTLVAQLKNRKRKASSDIEIARNVFDRMPLLLIVNLDDDVDVDSSY